MTNIFWRATRTRYIYFVSVADISHQRIPPYAPMPVETSHRSLAAARPRQYCNVPCRSPRSRPSRAKRGHTAREIFFFKFFLVSRENGRGLSHGPAAGRSVSVDFEFSGHRFRNFGNAFNGPRTPRPAVATVGGRRTVTRPPVPRPRVAMCSQPTTGNGRDAYSCAVGSFLIVVVSVCVCVRASLCVCLCVSVHSAEIVPVPIAVHVFRIHLCASPTGISVSNPRV